MSEPQKKRRQFLADVLFAGGGLGAAALAARWFMQPDASTQVAADPTATPTPAETCAPEPPGAVVPPQEQLPPQIRPTPTRDPFVNTHVNPAGGVRAQPHPALGGKPMANPTP